MPETMALSGGLVYGPTAPADVLDGRRILAELERLPKVRLEPERPPAAINGVLAQVQAPGRRAGAPVRRPFGLALRRRRDDPAGILVADRTHRARPRLVAEAVRPPLQKTPPPLADGVAGRPRLGGDILIRPAVGSGQYDPATRRQLLAALGPPDPARERGASVVSQLDRDRRSSAWHSPPPRTTPTTPRRSARPILLFNGTGHEAVLTGDPQVSARAGRCDGYC